MTESEPASTNYLGRFIFVNAVQPYLLDTYQEAASRMPESAIVEIIMTGTDPETCVVPVNLPPLGQK